MLREQRVHDATGPAALPWTCGRTRAMTPSKTLLDLERTRLGLAVQRHRSGVLRRPDDRRRAHGAGGRLVMDRDAVVASLGARAAVAELRHRRPPRGRRRRRTRPPSSTSAPATAHGDQPAFVGVMSSVYVRQDGRWRLALYQQTPIVTLSGAARRPPPSSARPRTAARSCAAQTSHHGSYTSPSRAMARARRTSSGASTQTSRLRYGRMTRDPLPHPSSTRNGPGRTASSSPGRSSTQFQRRTAAASPRRDRREQVAGDHRGHRREPVPARHELVDAQDHRLEPPAPGGRPARTCRPHSARRRPRPWSRRRREGAAGWSPRARHTGFGPPLPVSTRLDSRRRDVAQLGSASALGAEGRRFKSCHPDVPTSPTTDHPTSRTQESFP